MLVGAIQLLKAENTPDHSKLFTQEMLQARFLSPVIITPPPEPDETGKVHLTKDNKIQFPMLTASDGNSYFMAFTDMEELTNWSKEEKKQTFIMKFDDYAAMVLGKDSRAAGFVVNPYGGNIIITKENIARLTAAKAAAKKEIKSS